MNRIPQNTEPYAAPHGLLNEMQAEVSAEASPLFTFVIRHMRLIVSALLLLVLLTIGYGLWHWQQMSALDEAHMDFGKIIVGSQENKYTALETLLADAPAVMTPAILLEMATVAVQNKDFEKALTAYAKVYANDPEGALGTIAAFNQAELLRHVGKTEASLNVLEQLQHQVPENMKALVLETMAATALQGGDKQKALAFYEAIIELAKTNGTEQNFTITFYKYQIAELKKQLQ